MPRGQGGSIRFAVRRHSRGHHIALVTTLCVGRRLSVTKGTDDMIKIVLVHDGNLPFAGIAEASYASYARRWGYAYESIRTQPGQGHPSWQKLACLVDQLRYGGLSAPQHWLLYVDTDSMVTNPTIALERFVDPYYDVIVSQDWDDNSPWSAGVMLLQRTRDTDAFLSVARTLTKWKETPPWDQAALHTVWGKQMTGCRVKVLPRRQLQSVPAGGGAFDPWQPGDFIAHVTGVANDHRHEWMRNFAERN
jgi:hypothetical protein